MDRTLSELGIANRETIIVVPCQSTRSLRPHQVSNGIINTSEDASNANGTGYFSYFRHLLSYVNPFSYLGGDTISVNPNAPTNSKFQFSILVLIVYIELT
jgi:UBX domain-containing protein 1/4